ncbi:hypothetical protein KGM_207607 [Danaus plexippus plexippus]|uniref:Uncharacterized protein n=1 Tax=Danaus plexippus plexippus TaxID=278856 RepID=A0A212F682_DANPL|nr:hypothetical protein KGM_207607 [Danaus plexippus plexippus]
MSDLIATYLARAATMIEEKHTYISKSVTSTSVKGLLELRRRLNKVDLNSYVPAKAPKFEVAHQVARLALAREHQSNQSQFYVNFVFSLPWEERHVETSRGYRQANFTETVLYGGRSVMVWAPNMCNPILWGDMFGSLDEACDGQ